MIRLADEHDGAAVHAIYAPFVRDTTISFELDVPTVEQMSRRITETTAHHPWLVDVDDETGVVHGYAYASTHRTRAAYRWAVEVSVYVGRDAARRGIGRALYEALFRVLVRQGFVNAYAGIALPNEASIGFHRALGFEPIGVYRNVGYKHGAWRDVAWFGRSLAAPTEPPPTLRALDEVLRELAVTRRGAR